MPPANPIPSDTEAADANAFRGLAAFSSASSGRPGCVGLARLYENEAIFLFMRQRWSFFHRFSGPLQNAAMPLLLCHYLREQKPSTRFVPYPSSAGYFILLTLVIISVFGLINRAVLTATLPPVIGAEISLASKSDPSIYFLIKLFSAWAHTLGFLF